MFWIKEHISKMPSFNAFETHIATIEETIEANPALCIETCKSLTQLAVFYPKKSLPQAKNKCGQNVILLIFSTL